jgi:ribonuclease HIII
MAEKPFVTELAKELVEKLRLDLQSQGFEFSTPPYTLFSAKKKNLSVTLYQSLKLCVQGKEMASFIEFYLEPEILKEFQFTHRVVDTSARIGSDETGKGDFFGPLCVASLFAQGKDVEKLAEIGVQDSKNINDTSIMKLCDILRKNFQYEVVRINPDRYNSLYTQFGNLNTLLAWAHATAIERLALKTGCKRVIVDKFANEYVVENAIRQKKLDIQIEQRVRAESDLVVAAASIMARGAFLDGMSRLSTEIGVELPKGASAKVKQVGRQLVHKFGPEILQKVCKTHFKTHKEILESL